MQSERGDSPDCGAEASEHGDVHDRRHGRLLRGLPLKLRMYALFADRHDTFVNVEELQYLSEQGPDGERVVWHMRCNWDRVNDT